MHSEEPEDTALGRLVLDFLRTATARAGEDDERLRSAVGLDHLLQCSIRAWLGRDTFQPKSLGHLGWHSARRGLSSCSALARMY